MLKDVGKTTVFSAMPPFNELKALDTGPIPRSKQSCPKAAPHATIQSKSKTPREGGAQRQSTCSSALPIGPLGGRAEPAQEFTHLRVCKKRAIVTGSYKTDAIGR